MKGIFFNFAGGKNVCEVSLSCFGGKRYIINWLFLIKT